MSIGQAKERAEIALEIARTRKEREAALHRQVIYIYVYIYRLLLIDFDFFPCTGSWQRTFSA